MEVRAGDRRKKINGKGGRKVGGGGEEAGSRDVAFHANVRFNKQEGQAEI